MWLRYIKVKERASSVIQTAKMETELNFTGTRLGAGTVSAQSKRQVQQRANSSSPGNCQNEISWNLQCKLRGKIARVIEKVELSLIFVLPNRWERG